MSALNPDYYEILGVPHTATPDEIKRRYRELARRYHPDVSRTPGAAVRFREINEANSVLSDAQKRATYDAKLKLDEWKRRPAQASGPKSQPAGSQRSQPSSAPGAPPPRPKPTASTSSSGPSRPTGSPRPAADPVETILAEARKAFSRIRYREADLLCRRANRIRRTSASFELLGDIFKARGRADDAVAMYSYALQLDRTNHGLQLKFDKLVGQSSGPTMAGNAARAARTSARPGDSVAPIRALITGLGSVTAAFLVVIASRISPPPATDPWFFDWDPLLIFALALTGLAAGFIAGANGLLARARDEAFSPVARANKRVVLPIGALLMGFAVVLVYAAFIAYIALGFVQERLSRSVLAAFAVSFFITVLFSLTCRASGNYILISGGNVVFLAFMAGWLASDGARK